MSDFPNIPAQELDRQMSLNFSGAFHCCQAAIPLMEPRKGVRKIVNISSNGAYNFDVFDPPHYRASKAALENLVQSYGEEVKNLSAVRVAIVDPGKTRTRMRAAAYPGEDPASVKEPAIVADAIIKLLQSDFKTGHRLVIES